MPAKASELAVGCMGYGLAAAFLVPWCALTFAFDAATFYSLAMQCRTYGYGETTGTIIDRQAVGKKGGGVTVTYEYAVDGQKHTGDRARYTFDGIADSVAGSSQDNLPVGKELPVYYNPADPADAVLLRGPAGVDVCQLWFLIPFNVIGIGASLMILRRYRGEFVGSDPRVIAFTPTGWEYRPYGRKWWFYFSMSLIAIAFLGAVGLIAALLLLPVPVAMGVSFVAGFGLAAVIATRLARRVTMRVDLVRGTIAALPRKAEPVTMPLDSWKGFTVEREVLKGSDEDQTVHHAVLRGGRPPRSVRLGEYLYPEGAEAAVKWLTEAMRVSAGSGSPT